MAFYEQQYGHMQFAEFERALSKGDKEDDDVDSVKKMNGEVVSSAAVGTETPKGFNKDRRPSKLITMPSCISLHSEIYDLTYDKEDDKDKGKWATYLSSCCSRARRTDDLYGTLGGHHTDYLGVDKAR